MDYFPERVPSCRGPVQGVCRCDRRYCKRADGHRRRNLCEVPENIIAFGPEKLGIDYRIHGADEYILVSGMEEAVLVYMEAIKNLLAI